MSRTWLSEFGSEWDVPEWLRDNCEDCSWHNDAMPGFLHGPTNLFVWSDHPDPERSEFPDYRESGTWKRFHVVQYIDGETMSDTVFATDSVDDLIEFLSRGEVTL